MTKDKGRGIFAYKPLKEGELLVVEKAVAEAYKGEAPGMSTSKDGSNCGDRGLLQKCTEIVLQKGIKALRISYLYDGSNKANLETPPIDIFVNNQAKKYANTVTDIPVEKLSKIIEYNTFANDQKEEENEKLALFCFKSLFNHRTKPNVRLEFKSSNLVFMYAS